MECDVIPVGSTVRVRSGLGGVPICQVIDVRVNKRLGQVLYALGHITPRRGLLSWLPKKQPLYHLVRRDYLELLELPERFCGQGSDPKSR